MRGRRSKAYKKLMAAYGHTFGFREPYQVLVDAEIILDAVKHKIDLLHMLEKTLHGKIKPMITNCSVRHLYALPTTTEPVQPISATSTTTTKPKHLSQPPPPKPLTSPTTPTTKSSCISLAKSLELRRCNHHTLPSPLSEFDCLRSCIVSSNGENKNRYIVATQDREVRAYLRSIPGVPLVYINRSVMIMEPMADVSWQKREREEWGKFTVGLKESEKVGVEMVVRGLVEDRKRKREEGEEGEEGEGVESGEKEALTVPKRRKGPKQPNPLSVKKKKKVELPVRFLPNPKKEKGKGKEAAQTKEEGEMDNRRELEKKRRRRKHHGSVKAIEGERNHARVDDED